MFVLTVNLVVKTIYFYVMPLDVPLYIKRGVTMKYLKRLNLF